MPQVGGVVADNFMYSGYLLHMEFMDFITGKNITSTYSPPLSYIQNQCAIRGLMSLSIATT